MILTDKSLLELMARKDSPIIENGITEQIKHDDRGKKIPSYGINSCGYDVRCVPHWKTVNKRPLSKGIKLEDLDSPEWDANISDNPEETTYWIEPGRLVLTTTVEKFNVPTDVMGVCMTKSTWARLGVYVLTTALMPGWSGQLVLEITNLNNVPVELVSGVGIAQVCFHKLDGEPLNPYSVSGKYMRQVGVQSAKL